MDLVGAIKVKDGFFIGDEFSAQDLEFVVANKVSRIINCAARQVANHWEPTGVQYLSLYWAETNSQVLFDGKQRSFPTLFAFIEKSLVQGESVLVHSVRGNSRCLCVASAYLMRKYSWSLSKALEFLNSRRNDIAIRPSFLLQLAQLEKKIGRTTHGPRTSDWNQLGGNSEEIVVRNTFLNAQKRSETTEKHIQPERTSKVHWAEGDLLVAVNPSAKNQVQKGFVLLRSAVKGNSPELSKVPLPRTPPKTGNGPTLMRLMKNLTVNLTGRQPSDKHRKFKRASKAPSPCPPLRAKA